ncbi:hypothetical protein MRB53_019779 [Persea americana]|uniref:Uncharacterized protein n=1 Tax=Persea americana TaxID=3435 RepID=A0ACC2KZ18_PERAE|nr:hypothetical protein MRB53_019779 [Persea americana]|eukprot:TRINITY_DN27395_c0_g2_i2.p1 TRINITY_DN27395_c0_g2~~TRINITY_DN27395_c0_g2_i2.p1  ORF type:complete len:263 (-),score=45.80 TRINITY_DN27395_c0_g2_i2:196-915(-)
MDSSSSSNSNFHSCDEVLEMTSSSSPSYKSTHSHCRFLDEEQFFTTVATSPPKRRAGRKKFRETRHPVYRGVRRRNGDRWVCEVREPGKKSRIWLGTFPTPEMAARAHDVAAMALRGRSACLNFSDSAWLLPIPASASAKDIQKAAAEAAEAFRPSESEFESVSNQDVEAESRTVSTEDTLLLYMDEEVNFGMDMPGLLASMAEGLLLSPPHSSSGFHWDDVEDSVDMSLWSYSIPIGN